MFSRQTKFKLALSFIIVGLFFIALPVLAQVNTGIEFGQYTGLTSVDIRITIAKIIRVALGLLGIVALGLVLYGGYMYMTAEGNEEQISKAKKVLIDAAIGLAIILSAFAITQFVLSKLTEGTLGGGTGTNIPLCTGDDCYPGPSGGGALYATSTPSGQLPIKNVVVSVTFFNGLGWSAAADSATLIAQNVRINKINGDGTFTAATGELILLDNNTKVEFHPNGTCIDSAHPDDSAFSDPSSTCFEKNSNYQVEISVNIYAANKTTPLTCNTQHPCESYFTTGEMFDRTPPTVSIVQPGDGAVAMAYDPAIPFCPQIIGADFTDDSGVKEVDFYSDKLFNFNSQPITSQVINPYSATGTIETSLWHPFLIDPNTAEIDNVYVKAFDLDGHSTQSAKQRVKILPITCYNGQVDADLGEIQATPVNSCPRLPDCGVASQCGACPGDACTTSLDCAGTFCDPQTSTCVARPKITNVEKKNGKEENYVTIYGQNFGAVPGVVVFNDNKQASVVSCFSKTSWKPGSVVVKVPAGATTGPLEIRTASYTGAGDATHLDVTNDSWGPNFSAANVFVVNNIARPGLCGVDPASGQPGITLSVEGSQLGTVIGQQPAGAFQAQVTVNGTPATGRLKFGDYLAPLTAWSGTLITTKAPNLPPQYLTVQAEVAGEESNSVPFTINAVSKDLLPQIDYIDPENGPVGSYVTIFGSNFGTTNRPQVFFGATQAVPPANCPDSWSDTQIIVKVPDTPVPLTPGDYLVRINNLLGESNEIAFTVDTSPKRPGLCSILPDNGPVNTLVALRGEGFGGTPGALEFWKSVTTTPPAANWADGAINYLVPTNTQTGPVKVWNNGAGLYSNLLNFKIQNCKTDKTVVCVAGTKCCAAGSCQISCPEDAAPKASVYSWLFSTGMLPSVPKVVEECGANKVPSPTPSQLWSLSQNVCINAQIKVKFSTLIKESTVVNNGSLGSFVVETCTDVDCGIPTVVTGGTLGFTLTNGKLAEGYTGSPAAVDTVTYTPPAATNNLLSQNTWYRVRLGTTIESFVFNPPVTEVAALEANLPVAYSFKFKTRNNTTLCVLGSAVTSPDPFSAKEFNKWYLNNADDNEDLYSVTALADENICWALDANAYDWAWNVGTAMGDTSIYAEMPLPVYKQKVSNSGVIGPAHETSIVHDPAGPLLNTPQSIAISGARAYVASYGSNALNLFDISNPAQPVFKNSIIRNASTGILLDGPRAMAVAGDLIYVASQNSQSLEIFRNMSDRLAPVGKITQSGLKPVALSVAGNYAYVVSTNPDNALYVFNVTDPADPRLASVLCNDNTRTCNYPQAALTWPRDIVVSGNYAYIILSGYGGDPQALEILDVSSPAQPGHVGRVDSINGGRALALAGKYVYVAASSDFYVIDVGDPANPVVKTSAVSGLGSQPRAVSVFGDYALLIDGAPEKKLYVINISNPLQPVLADSLADGAGGAQMPQPADLAVSGGYAYVVSDLAAGNLEVVRIFQTQDRGKPHQDLHTNNLNLETLAGGEHVWAKTTSGTKTVADDALLYIKLTNPRVLEKWPDCNAACVNAEVGGQFNVELSPAFANISNIILCNIAGPNADCGANPNLATGVSLRKQAIDKDTLVIVHPDLVANSYYRVIFKGDPATGLKSANGIEMDQTMGTSTLNYKAGDPNCLSNLTCDNHSWTFLTKSDPNKCAVSTVEVQPAESVVQWIGAQASYFSIPRGAKDACSPFGQRLNAWEYGWAWTSAPTAVATISNFDKTAAVNSICNSSCVRSGQAPWNGAPLCGNNVVEAGEDCDPPGAACTAQCLDNPKTNLGTLKCVGDQNKDCCGNSIVEANEDCDAGISSGATGSSCTNKCLNSGTPEYGSFCGDGVRKPNEECDAGANNGKDGSGCTINCLTTAKVYGKNAAQPVCGNGVWNILDNYEECDGERACTRDCQNAGASLESGSFCGDGAFGWGEDTGCDVAGVGDGKTDPWQLAYAVGNGTVDPATKQQIADITATAPTAQSGAAKFILQCGYAPVDFNCPAISDVNKGVGEDSCCYQRPTATVLEPSVTPNTCPNTVIKVYFDALMDQASFTDKLTGEYNIALATSTPDAPVCPAGYRQVAVEQPPQNLWQKVLSFGRRLLGLPARADVFCQGGVDYSLSFAFVTSTPSTTVSLNLKTPLAFSQNFRIVLMPGIKTAKGVSLQQPIVPGGLTDFRTKDSLCKIEKVTLDPQMWLFSTLGNDTSDDTAQIADADKEIKDIDKVFTATASYINKAVPDSPIQEIQPTSVYNWIYTWSVGDNGAIVMGPTRDADTAHPDQSKEFKAQANPSKNGLTQIGVEFKITADKSASPTVGATYPATSTVQVFICNNPWPNNTMNPGYGLGWADIAPVTAEGRGWNNFKLMYCRDAGKENDTSDDLPELRLPAVLTHESVPNDPIFKEFFLTFKRPADTAPQPNTIKDDKDSIGIRVYPNTQHLTLLDWYNSQPNIVKGVPVPVKVGRYDALQEGRTFYISGLNIVDSGATPPFSIYSNVFVFSFSNNPTAETLNIVNQLLANLALNINRSDTDTIDSAYRDFRRVQDLQLVTKKLGNYYQKNGSYPDLKQNLEIGTFLPSQTNSRWRSWQGVLGNALGYNLPVDPFNNFNGCGSGLVSRWSAEGDARDSLGTNNGELKNVVFDGQGKAGKAFKFNGTTGMIRVSNNDSLNLSNEITLSAWIKPDSARNGSIISKAQECDSAANYKLVLKSDGKLSFIYWDGTGVNKSFTSYSPVVSDFTKWYHVALTYNYVTRSANLYVDGLATPATWGGVAPVNSTPILTNNDLAIGADLVYNPVSSCTGISVGGARDPFKGLIDEVSIYNRVLGSLEVQDLYNGSKYDPQTCWNSVDSTFVCPAGSRIYQYETKGGASAALKADFELPSNMYQWVSALNDTRPAGVVNTLSYGTEYSCDSTVQGIGTGGCGDGIVTSPAEDCEIGQKRASACAVGDYKGKLFEKCKSDCSGFEPDGTPGLVGRWKGDGNAFDSSGNNNNGVVSALGMTYVPGKVGKAFEYKNGGGYVTTPYNNFNSPELTVSAWVYKKSNNDWLRIIAREFWVDAAGGNPAHNYPGSNFLLDAVSNYVSNGNNFTNFVRCAVNIGPTDDSFISVFSANETVPQNKWAHVACSYDGYKATVYINGQKSAESAPSATYQPMKPGTLNLGVGVSTNNTDVQSLFDGWIDEAQWYNRALNAGEINNLYLGKNVGGCVPQGRCGDGIIQKSPQGPETCDDGVNNGKYGYCNSNCSGRADVTNVSGYCGNNTLDTGKEVCDSSESNIWIIDGVDTRHKNGWCSLLNTKNCDRRQIYRTTSLPEEWVDIASIHCSAATEGYCKFTGPRYNRVKADSCSWDCQSNDYCGDGRVNSTYEECEKSESCQVGTCSNDPNLYCEADLDCGGANTCQNKQSGKRYCEVPGEVKLDFARAKACSASGSQCAADVDCVATGGGNCNTQVLFKDVTGNSNKYIVAPSSACQWAQYFGNGIQDFENWMTAQWGISGVTFLGPPLVDRQTCFPLQAPPPVYQAGSCGNGNLDTGETCDDGSNNGQICSDFSVVPLPGVGTCTYCAYGCQQVITVQQ